MWEAAESTHSCFVVLVKPYSGIFKWGRFPSPGKRKKKRQKKESCDLFCCYNLCCAIIVFFWYNLIRFVIWRCSCFRDVHLSWLYGNFGIMSSAMESIICSWLPVECTGQDAGLQMKIQHSLLGMLRELLFLWPSLVLLHSGSVVCVVNLICIIPCFSWSALRTIIGFEVTCWSILRGTDYFFFPRTL